MNEYDLLLQWLSARPNGAVSAVLLKEACLALNQRARDTQGVLRTSTWPYRFQDTLYRCGHIEHVRWDTWAVLPPTVLWLRGKGKQQDGEAHVYGARSPHLQAQLQQTWDSQFIVMAQNEGPAIWKWVGTRAQSEDFARSFRSTVYEERGESLLEALPNLAEAVQHFRVGASPTGHGWEYWHITASPTSGMWGRWVPKPSELVQGIYRTTHHPRFGVYVAPKPPHALLYAYHLDLVQNPDHLSIAQWHELAESGDLCVCYDASEHTLIIPHGNAALPLLLDRALRLASGCCPRVVSETHGRTLVFPNIERRRARQVARVLGIPLEITHG
jgi:hypothetical protein